MPQRLEPIQTAGLVCCEGPDDFAFLEWLRHRLGISDTTLIVESLNGRYELHDYLASLSLRDELRRLRSFGIVCDADRENGLAAFRRVRDDLRNTRFTAPSLPNDLVRGPWLGGMHLSVGVFIMPDNQSAGALEDLCLEAVRTDPGLPCVDDFLRCVAATGITWRQQHVSKARLNAWLSARPDPRRRLREAFPAQVFPIQNPAFDAMKDFLTRLAAAAGEPGGQSA